MTVRFRESRHRPRPSGSPRRGSQRLVECWSSTVLRQNGEEEGLSCVSVSPNVSDRKERGGRWEGGREGRVLVKNVSGRIWGVCVRGACGYDFARACVCVCVCVYGVLEDSCKGLDTNLDIASPPHPHECLKAGVPWNPQANGHTFHNFMPMFAFNKGA